MAVASRRSAPLGASVVSAGIRWQSSLYKYLNYCMFRPTTYTALPHFAAIFINTDRYGPRNTASQVSKKKTCFFFLPTSELTKTSMLFTSHFFNFVLHGIQTTCMCQHILVFFCSPSTSTDIMMG